MHAPVLDLMPIIQVSFACYKHKKVLGEVGCFCSGPMAAEADLGLELFGFLSWHLPPTMSVSLEYYSFFLTLLACAPPPPDLGVEMFMHRIINDEFVILLNASPQYKNLILKMLY